MGGGPRGAARNAQRLLAVLISVAVGAGALAAQASARLPAGWRQVVQQAERAGIRTGFVAVELGSGAPLAAHRAEQGFLPASNQKLATVAAFLHRLGPGYRFATGFELDATGELVVRAGGDPNWITGSDHDPAEMFAAVAVRLRMQGVTAVRGVRLERGPFTGPSRPPGWPSDQYHRYYCAPSGAALIDQACWKLRVARGGGSVDAETRLLAPAGGLRLRGSIRLTDDREAGGRYHAAVDGDWLAVSGKFWTRGQPREHRGAVPDAEAVFLRALEAGLRRGGVRVGAGAADTERELVLRSIETPLPPALERILGASSNVCAEQLLRVLGAEQHGDGSFAGGARAVRAALVDLVGALPDAVTVVDGSGMSRGNRLTPRFVAALLREVWQQPWADAFRAAMARGGRPGTTLRRRFRDDLGERVLAKTGTLRGASALSGVVLDAAGDTAGGGVVFAILMNWERGSSSTARRLQDELVRSVAR